MAAPNSSHDPDTTDDREQAKERYEGIVRTVDMQTGDPQPVGCRKQLVVANRHRAGYEPTTVKRTLDHAVGKGDLLRWTGDEGHTRYALPTPEAVRKVIASKGLAVTEDTVRDFIEHHIGEEGDRKAIIGAANQLMGELEENESNG